MKHIFQVILKEKTGLPRQNNPLKFGVPLPSGQFFNHRELVLTSDKNIVLPSSKSVIALWPDKSIKWCLIESLVTLGAHGQLELSLSKKSSTNDPVPNNADHIVETETAITVNTKNCTFILNKINFDFIEKVYKGEHELVCGGSFCLKSPQYGGLETRVKEYHYQTIVAGGYPFSSQVVLNGEFRSEEKDLVANFETTLTFFYATDTVKSSITLHNPKSAHHDSGLWDLGDPNSLFISSFRLGINIANKQEVQWKAEQVSPWLTLNSSPLTIYQESSGGLNWDSPIHKNRHNEVAIKNEGFHCTVGKEILVSGQRASPSLSINSDAGCINISVSKFWQNCPKALNVNEDKVQIGLFPEQFQDGFELQPGEKKTHHVYLNFSDDKTALDWVHSPIEISLNPDWIEQCKVFSYFKANIENDTIQNIINEGLMGSNNFFKKREAIDEYGWRNFGEIYADHETDGHEGNHLFVSHYNNQYDPLYGFLRQYALTGEYRWFELADDLARHITDIDIYHTDHDKIDYNNGLFWHTDHYLEAKTATHRSYSKYQQSNAYIDHAGGGGPGGQHCYATGLLYHYLLTGNKSSKHAVFELTKWVSKVYEGSGTIFDILLSIKNRNRIDLKNITTGKYPLDRGTGNYINAILDTYVLTQKESTLKQVAYIIKNTVHPLDDIVSRNLENVENTWFYTVFFQSVCRYLSVKEEVSDLDKDFYFARDSLLHYADWMTEHEYPYLEKPEILEFPNHTWTAQDIRKVNLLWLAAYYSPKTEHRYLQKADEIYKNIIETLPTEKTRTYTRILAILMQNHGVVSYCRNKVRQSKYRDAGVYQPLKKQTPLRFMMNIGMEILKTLRRFSLYNETIWLCSRSKKLGQIFRYRP